MCKIVEGIEQIVAVKLAQNAKFLDFYQKRSRAEKKHENHSTVRETEHDIFVLDRKGL